MSILRSGTKRIPRHVAAPSAVVEQPRSSGIADQMEQWQPETLSINRLRDETEAHIVSRVHARLAATLGRSLDTATPDSIRALLTEQFPAALEDEKVTVNRTDRLRLQDAVFAEVVGYGPIQDLITDDQFSEIMVNGPRQVWVERDGKLYKTDITFNDADHVIRVIQRIVAPLGRRCDESSPMVDARLPDGSRVNAIIPPLSLAGPTLTIRKFRRVPFNAMDLLQNGTATAAALQFLAACVRGRLNIIVAGGSGAGKTTLMNTLSNYVSGRERIVTIEDAAELQLQQEHVIPLETRPANAEGRGEIGVRDLFKNAMRMRPDRVIIGECRGPEALDMLQAMNTGHDGSLTTIHANGPRDSLSRIETMVLMGGAELPLRAIREQIVSAIDLVCYVERMQDGTRRITQISEVRGLEGEVVTMQDIFAFHQEGMGMQGGRVIGELRPTGIRPSFAERLSSRGLELPPSLFGYTEAQ